MDFDNYGHLVPYDIIDTDLAAFERIFVTDFTHSSTRSGIFEAYLNYLSDLKQIIGGGFYQWIDGSFTTLKRNPNDIDLVTFVDFGTYQRYEKQLEEVRKIRFRRGNKIDGYFVKCYPETHHQRQLFEFDRLQWQFDFGRSFVNKREKGIIQINF